MAKNRQSNPELRYPTSVKHMLKLLQSDFKKNRRTVSNRAQDPPNSPHGTQIQPTPKILIFFENLIELKF